jgi:hypothetical protein
VIQTSQTAYLGTTLIPRVDRRKLRSGPTWPRHRLASRRNCDDLRWWHDLRRRRNFSAAVGASLCAWNGRREQKKTDFEGLLFGAILVAAAIGAYSLVAGPFLFSE